MGTLPTTTLNGTGVTATFADTSDWGSGFIGSVTLANQGSTPINGWTIAFNLANNITNLWNGSIISHTGTRYVIGNLGYNSAVAAGGTVAFGFQADGGNPALPTTATLNGSTLSTAPVLPTLSVADTSVTDGAAGSFVETFTVQLSAASARPVTVAFKTVNDTAIAGTDYAAKSGTLTFAAGSTTAAVAVTTHPSAPGSTKAYTLQLSNAAGAAIGDGTATGTIVTPALPTIAVGDASVTEGKAATLNESFTLTLSRVSATPVSVAFKTVNGTAIAGTDYDAKTGTVTFAAGATTANITVVTHPGTVGTSKAYSLQLSNPSGATIADGIAAGAIVTPALPAIAVADASVTEGKAANLNESFTLTLSKASSTPVTVAFTTVNGTAVAGTAYDAKTGTVTFAAGTTTATVAVVTHPGTVGTSKSYSLQLSNPNGATIADGTATGTIVTPAPATTPSASVANVSVAQTVTTGSGGTLLPAGFLSTDGNQIVSASGTPVKIAAVNWYGLETPDYAPQGLWTQSYQTMMKQMVSLGFNTIRLPFSLDLLKSTSVPDNIDYSKNPDLQGLNGLQVMDKIIGYAGQIGLKVVLDDHRSAAGSGPNGDGLWYDGGYTEAQWISDWQMLAARYAGNSTVIGADLSNEPHDPATWGDGSANDWEAAATRAGDAVQSVNSNWLMIVEGIQDYQNNYDWWGGNLMGVASHPVTLTDPDKVVYSPHDYPSTVSSQPWFSAANYPNNLPGIWNQYWGYIYQNDIAPVFVGEYGSKLQTTSDQQWMQQLVSYMNAPGGAGGAEGISWGYWDWNPTSGDTGGILEDDWSTVDPTKMEAISPGLYHAPSGTTVGPDQVDFTVSLSAAPTQTVTLHYATADGTAHAGTDYAATSGTLTFAPGDRTETVPVELLGKETASKLTFILTLSDALGANLGQATGTATIVPAPGATAAILPAAIMPAAGAAATSGTVSTTTTLTALPLNTETSMKTAGSNTVGSVLAMLSVENQWSTGLTANVLVANNGAAATSAWTVEVDTANAITNLWNGTILSHSGDAYVVGNADSNGSIAAGANTSFGFQAAGTDSVTTHLLNLN